MHRRKTKFLKLSPNDSFESYPLNSNEVCTENSITRETIQHNEAYKCTGLFASLLYAHCINETLHDKMTSAQTDQSSLCTQWVAKVPMLLHADSEDWSDWEDDFAGHTDHFVGFRGSYWMGKAKFPDISLTKSNFPDISIEAKHLHTQKIILKYYYSNSSAFFYSAYCGF